MQNRKNFSQYLLSCWLYRHEQQALTRFIWSYTCFWECKGAFTPVDALFANHRKCLHVFKLSRTLANMNEGLLFTLPEPHIRAVVLEHLTVAPGLSKLSICAASIVILSEIEKRRLRKKRRMWESSFLKGRNYVQLLANLKADETGLQKFQPHVIIGFWFFTKQNWR